MLNLQKCMERSKKMTGDIKLILEIIDPIIILLIMFCAIILLITFYVMRWDKSITIIIIVGFIITAAITLIAQIPTVKDKTEISEIQTYTTVEDKFIQTRGKITNYYAKVKVGDYKELEEMQITSEQYEAIGNGSKILCIVYLKNDKIVDVEFAEVHGRE